MDQYYGFDLGDAESAVTRLKNDENAAPEVLNISGARSIITAYAIQQDGLLAIGEQACYCTDAKVRKLRFKSRFLKDDAAAKDIRLFAGGVLAELYKNGSLDKGADTCFYVGCPAGWDAAAREDYRGIFESAYYPPVKIIAESRAALVGACQSKYLQIGYDILTKPLLVVDIGSSTTDFAYVADGKTTQLLTSGETFLGGGALDEMLLEYAVERSENRDRIREIFRESEAWKNYCEFAARRLKEQYFTDEGYWETAECRQSVNIRYGGETVTLTIKMDKDLADRLLNHRSDVLGGKSFMQRLEDSMREAKAGIPGKAPELIFLTGGVSRMNAVKALCRKVFDDAITVTGNEPEFSIARGLAYCGRVDEDIRQFRNEVAELTGSTTVEQLVDSHIKELYSDVTDALISPLLDNAVMPVIERWRNGEVKRLKDVDPLLKESAENWLKSDEARRVLAVPLTAWMRRISYELEQYTVPICARHHIPYSSLNISSYLALPDVDMKMDATGIFAVQELTFIIDAIVTIIVSLLCGGSGVALVAAGLPGIAAGAGIALTALLIGYVPMQKAMMHTNVPLFMRKMLPKEYYEKRITRAKGDIRKSLNEYLENGKNEEILAALCADISKQIDGCLTNMAEIVEIPIA